MSNDSKRPDSGRTDWGPVDKIVQRRTANEMLPLQPDGLQKPGTGIQKPDSSATVQPDGVIASFKANSITRKAALNYLSVYYEKQLEAARHHLTEVVRVRKAESTAVAEQLLASINSQQMQFLVEVGLRNEDVRSRAMVQLNDMISRTLREIQEADWPEALRQQAINGILDRQKKVFERLMTDLGEA